MVDAGSFTAAADRLDMSRAMASKYVAALEEHLGTRLLHRTTRKLTLTESGAAYYERCAQILTDIEDAEADALKSNAAPRGLLRMTIPLSFGLMHMGPVLAAYMYQYPEVKVDLVLTDRRRDLIEEGLDLAIRIGALPESGLIARKLASDRLVVCAAPDYLKRRGEPRTPAELAHHHCLLYAYDTTRQEWKFDGPDGTHSVRVTGRLRANNGDVVRLAGLAAAGVMRQPSFLVGEDLRAGRLVEVLSDYRSEELGIYIVYASRKHLPPKVRSFVDFAAQAFAMKKEW